MPINVFGNSSHDNNNKIDTSLFIQKPYLRTNYIESNIEEDIDLKNQYRIKNLPDPISIQEACNKNYVDNLFNDPSIIKNNIHIDLNDRNITNARFIQVNQLPQIDSHLTAKLYVDTEIDKQTIVRNNQDNDLDDNKLTNINSITINNSPTDNKHACNKKYVDDELDKNTILRFNQTLQNYLKVSIGNDIYNVTKYNKTQLTDISRVRVGNSGLFVLNDWRIVCNDINGLGNLNRYIKSTKTSSPTSQSGATSLPPIGNGFMYIETSGAFSGDDNIFASFERRDIIQITNTTLYINRYSILTNNSLKSMGRFRIQLLLEDDIWETQYTIPKNSQYNDNSTDWSLLNLDFTKENYGIKLIYDQIDTAHADMCFSDITITHSVY